MIAVAVIGILVAVALPSYREQVRRSVRSEAQAYMMSVAGRQQQFLVDTRAYAATLTAVGVPVPASVTAGYTLTLTVPAVTPPTFSLSLVPTARQSGEKCGTLGINQIGTKTAGSSGCW